MISLPTNLAARDCSFLFIQFVIKLKVYPGHRTFKVIYPSSMFKKKKQTEEKAKVVAAVWGTKFILVHTALQIYHQDDLKKRTHRIKATWWNG